MTDRISIIIADTGPLIALARIDLLELLTSLPWHFYAPTAVVKEASADASKPGALAVSKALENGWLFVQDTNESITLGALEQLLDKGEAAAIALAEEHSAALLIDERRGRKVAKHRGIQVMGTGSLLVHAKKLGLIESVELRLDELCAIGYRLSDALVNELKRMAGE